MAHTICYRCGEGITPEQADRAKPVVKRERASGRRVDFHATCWRLIVDSSADRGIEAPATRQRERGGSPSAVAEFLKEDMW